MNKKLFLSLIFVCLAFGLNFSSCGEEEEEAVTGLWENLRSTAWQMENDKVTYTIGFYGPQNGPNPISEPTDGSYYNDDWKNPYAVIRVTSKTSGRYYFYTMKRLIISRTGRISESADGFNRGWDYRHSFNVSFDGSSLTISDAKYADGSVPYEPVSDISSYNSYEIYDKDNDYNTLYKYLSPLNQINGTYRKYKDDPKFAFDEGRQELWSNIRNTAWTKQGDSKPSIGFYDLTGGPDPKNYSYSSYYGDSYYIGYVFFMTPEGRTASSTLYRDDYGKDGVYINAGGNNPGAISFKIKTNGNGTLTISNITLSNYLDGNTTTKSKFQFPIYVYDDYGNIRYQSGSTDYTESQMGTLFNGTYTLTSSNYDWK